MGIHVVKFESPYYLKDYEKIDPEKLRQKIQLGSRRDIPPVGDNSEVDITPESLQRRFGICVVALNNEEQTGIVRLTPQSTEAYLLVATLQGEVEPVVNKRIFHINSRRSIFPVIEDDRTIAINTVVVYTKPRS